MKGQNKTPEKDLNQMERSNLLNAEFKTLIIRMLNEIRGRVDELRISTNRNRKGNIKMNWSKMKNTLTEMRETLQKSTVE